MKDRAFSLSTKISVRELECFIVRRIKIEGKSEEKNALLTQVAKPT